MMKEKISKIVDKENKKKVLGAVVLVLLFPFLLNAFLAVTSLKIPIPDQLECEQRVPDKIYRYSIEAGDLTPEVGGTTLALGYPNAGEIDPKPCRYESLTGYVESYTKSRLGMPRKESSVFEG